jgi:hypothetical protein
MLAARFALPVANPKGVNITRGKKYFSSFDLLE